MRLHARHRYRPHAQHKHQYDFRCYRESNLISGFRLRFLLVRRQDSEWPFSILVDCSVQHGRWGSSDMHRTYPIYLLDLVCGAQFCIATSCVNQFGIESQ